MPSHSAPSQWSASCGALRGSAARGAALVLATTRCGERGTIRLGWPAEGAFRTRTPVAARTERPPPINVTPLPSCPGYAQIPLRPGWIVLPECAGSQLRSERLLHPAGGRLCVCLRRSHGRGERRLSRVSPFRRHGQKKSQARRQPFARCDFRRLGVVPRRSANGNGACRRLRERLLRRVLLALTHRSLPGRSPPTRCLVGPGPFLELVDTRSSARPPPPLPFGAATGPGLRFRSIGETASLAARVPRAVRAGSGGGSLRGVFAARDCCQAASREGRSFIGRGPASACPASVGASAAASRVGARATARHDVAIATLLTLARARP